MFASQVFNRLSIHGSALALLVFIGCEQPNEHLTLGNNMLEKKEYAAAVEHFTEAITQNPRSLSSYVGRGQAHTLQGEFSAAINDYEHAVGLNPKHKKANERLAYAYLDAGEGFKARDQITQLEKQLAPREYLLAIARAELLCGEAKPALEYLNRLIDSEPNQAQGRYYRGIVHANLGQLPAADEDFTIAIELAPEKASAYWRRALVRDRLQQTQLAKSDRKKATQLDPTHAFAESELGKNMVESLKGTGSETGVISLQPLRPK